MKPRMCYANEPIKATVIKDFPPRPEDLRFRKTALRPSRQRKSRRRGT